MMQQMDIASLLELWTMWDLTFCAAVDEVFGPLEILLTPAKGEQ